MVENGVYIKVEYVTGYGKKIVSAQKLITLDQKNARAYFGKLVGESAEELWYAIEDDIEGKLNA